MELTPVARRGLFRSDGISLPEFARRIHDGFEAAAPEIVSIVQAILADHREELVRNLRLLALDGYLKDIFEPLFVRLKRLIEGQVAALRGMLDEFAHAYAPFRGIERRAWDTIDRDTNPQATQSQLMALKAELEGAYRAVCPKPDIQAKADEVEEIFREFLELEASSKIRFNAVNLGDLHEAFWAEARLALGEANELVARARSEDRPEICRDLRDLLLAIPLRIRWEKLNGDNQELRNIEDQVLAALFEGARRIGAADSIADYLREARSYVLRMNEAAAALRYVRATRIAGEITNRKLPELLSSIEQSELLTPDQRGRTSRDVRLSLEQAVNEWQTLISEFGMPDIVRSHLSDVNARLLRVKAAVEASLPDQQVSLLDWWFTRLAESGFPFDSACRVPDHSANAPDCWRLGPPESPSDDRWLALDEQLSVAEGLVEEFFDQVGRS
jgi:hypothetical protein